ncbi:MAG: hypothetical protein AAB535_03430 [Patescibacteria group bacterium]
MAENLFPEGNISQGPGTLGHKDRMVNFSLDDDEEQEKSRRHRAQQEFNKTKSKENYREIAEGKYDSIVDLIVEAKTEEDRKYWTYFALERIVDYNDDWSARINREDLAKRVAMYSPERAELQGKIWDPESQEAKKYESIHKSLTIIQDVDLVFDQWFGFFKKMASSGKIFQLAFGQEPEYMPPARFKRIYADLPGFKEGDGEWKSISEQIDISLRAYIYLALQSDRRWVEDFEWYKSGDGFKKLFVNDATRLEWTRQLKLKTLPYERNNLASLRGKTLETLTPAELVKLDEEPAMNKFADPGMGSSINAISEAMIDILCEGKYKDNMAMKMQARIALNFAEKTMRYFGLDAMYGTRRLDYGDGDKATKVAAEDYPWSSYLTDLMRPQDEVTYRKQSSYFPGPVGFANFAPDHIMVDFLRFLRVADPAYPESKSMARSGFELFRDGKTVGEIMAMEDRIGDWDYRAYLIRILFALREDSGAWLALNGDLVRGKNKDNVFDEKFLEDIEKSIHIVCRAWIPTKGRIEKWTRDNRIEIDKKAKDDDFLRKLDENYVSRNDVLTDEAIKMEAADSVLSKHVKMEKNKWKAIVLLNVAPYLSKDKRKILVQRAQEVGFLDGAILNKLLNINFELKPEQIIGEMREFIRQSKDSKN